MPEAERQREMGNGEKKERYRSGAGRAGEKVRVSFPLGKVICKGIVPKSVTKGENAIGGGGGGGVAGAKEEQRDGVAS